MVVSLMAIALSSKILAETEYLLMPITLAYAILHPYYISVSSPKIYAKLTYLSTYT